MDGRGQHPTSRWENGTQMFKETNTGSFYHNCLWISKSVFCNTYILHGSCPKCSVSKYTEKDLKGTGGARFPVDSNSDSEEHMQLLNHTAGLRNEVLRISKEVLSR